MQAAKDKVLEYEFALGTEYDERIYQPESRWAKFIPGGYSPTRCLKLKGRPMMFAVLALAGCAILFFGYDASVMSQVNTNANYLRLMGANSGTNRDSATVGGLVSLWFGGFAIGALLVGLYADRIGRLKTVELGCIWALLGAALQTSAQNITWMSFGRVIGGIGCGHLNTAIPIWTSELADPHLRGAFVAFQFMLAISGSTLVYWVEFACVKTRSEEFAWRFPLGLQVIFLLFIIIIIPFYPESPRYLAKTGRFDDAHEILKSCRIDADAVKIAAEMQEIREAIHLEATSTSHNFIGMLLCSDKLHTRRRVFLACGVQIMQQLTGINFIAIYAPEMFSLAGYTGDKPAILAGGNFFGYVLSVACAIYLCDRVGRRKLMMIGASSAGIVLIIGGVLSHLVLTTNGDPMKRSQYGAGVTAILYIFTFIYGSVWITICWVYPTEIFPLASRARGTALSSMAFALTSGTLNEITPYLITAVGFWVFFLFALTNLAMLIPIYLFYIETANRHLEDLSLLFASKSSFVWRAEKEFAELKSREDHIDHRAE